MEWPESGPEQFHKKSLYILPKYDILGLKQE